MKVCRRQSVGWIAEAWKRPLKKPRLCSSRAEDPFSTRGSFSENMRLSEKQASSTWGWSWIDDWFGEHLQIATAKADQCGANLTRLMPNIGGPREAKRRLVASVVLPKLLYAAPVWANALKNHAFQRKLYSAQRWLGEQTGRWTYRLILEFATWLNRKHGELGFCLAVGAELTPDTMVCLMLQSERICLASS